ncbi:MULTISPECIES: arsenate reductase ArsC [unclassified Massilia]|uniref:arsenate reductase ArsC n=1 Tax=unclassified Massilia TaxID=2609279 RepID=UPI0017815B2B|nr:MULTISPECIES: arsenate reductase ArsC [unclassified Massilia]MBD8529338.1 arsenate reductase ArsC [Massilia sp. CFBP 13647]MBD8672731.1 arsenate reductase ArsC [Massilia sp. CFBP 13721]
MDEKVYNVLFLGTTNSVRSLMAEALLTVAGGGRFRGFSAGSSPSGVVHPFTLEQIATTAYPIERLRSKSWDEFATPDAPQMDFIITLCDDAAGEARPEWPGHPISAHWAFSNPAACTADDLQTREQFHKVFHQIRMRISTFVSLPLERLEKNAIHREVSALGRPPAQGT